MTTALQNIPFEMLEKLNPAQKKELLLLLEERQLRSSKVVPLSRFEFVNAHHMTHKYRKPSFENRHFLLDLYNDTSQKIVVKKAVQVGVSEWALCDALYMCMAMHLSGAYILTKSRLRDDFVAERINPVLREVPYYAAMVGETNNLGIKQLGKGVLRFLGSNSESEFISFPADFMIIDEVDRCDQANLALVPDRLQASDYKLERWISNPTVEGLGIDELYRASDQKEWMIQCDTCKESIAPDWFVNVVREKGSGFYEPLDVEFAEGKRKKLNMYCHHCNGVLNRLAKGIWVSRNPKSDISGYTMSQLYSPTVELADMWADFAVSLLNDTKMQVFWNNKLGLAYKAVGSKITFDMLKQCEQQYTLLDYYNGRNSVYAGVDVGSLLHVVIRERVDSKRKLLYAGAVENFDQLDRLIEEFKIESMVIDQYPETRKCREFQDGHSDVVWLADYHRGSTMEEVTYNERLHHIRADRTAVIDGVVQDIRSGAFVLPYNFQYLHNKEYVEQLYSSTRIKDEDSDKFRWISTKADHFLHAEVYCRLAERATVEPQIHDITVRSAPVLTPELFLDGQIDLRNNAIMQFFYED